MNTKTTEVMVQMFDKVKERIYLRIIPGLIFSHEEVVRKDQLENYTELHITAQKMPNKVFFNGKQVRLQEVIK